VLAAVLSGCGGGAASPAEVASGAGATSCDNSGFYIQNKLSGGKSVIYDCRFARKLPKCVTYSGNIASDSTDEVALLFQGSLNAGKPPCLAWHKKAVVRQAKLRELARLRAFNAASERDFHAAWHRGYAPWLADVQRLQLPNEWFHFLSSSTYSCGEFASDGCWKVEVITRDGCSTGLFIELGEMAGNTQIGTVYGDGGAIGPKTRAVIEIDADTRGSATARIKSITCD
jgi:hypothetical protein